MATGLGGEQLWLSPTVANNVNPYDDQSGQGNNGTNNGSTVVSDTGSGGTYAFDFDGVNDYIDCGNILDAPSDFSISMWIKRASTQANRGIAGKWQGTGYMLWMSTTANAVSLPINGGSHLTSPSSTSGLWTHVTGQFDSTSGTAQLYVDGVLVASASDTSPTSSPVNWVVGKYTDTAGTGQHYDGLADDIRQYNRTLTQAEITHLATSRGVLGPPGGATHYNPFRNARIYKQLSAEAQMSRPATLKIGATSYWTIMTYTDAGVLAL